MTQSFKTLCATSIAAIAFSAVSAAPAFAALAQIESDQKPAIMNLQGLGSVSAAPDMATLSSGVVTQAATAGEALQQNNAAMSALIAVIKSSGVEDADIQTPGFSVSPQYVYSDKRDENGYTLPPQINGYQVSNNVTVEIQDLANLGSVLDQMVKSGSNTISGITFGVKNSANLVNRARKQAVVDAREKADLYAKAAGVCLLRITNISESGGYAPQPKMMRAMAMDMAQESVPVQGGEVAFDINVSIEWEIGACPTSR